MISHRGNLARVALPILPPDAARLAARPHPPDGMEAGERLSRGLRSVVDRLDHGIILVEPDATVLFASATAREMIASGRGLVLCGGKLRATAPAASATLRNVIARCAILGPDRDAMPVLHCRIGEPAMLIVAAPAEPEEDAGLVNLFLSDPTRVAMPTCEYLRQ
ncbi:MAG: hypothetical protein JO048_08895, partial [Methylobacteriaceae bacterium]|nr:hypothetical protein [Methylobacteriaceae bacterium]